MAAERNQYSASWYQGYFPSNVGVIRGPRHWRAESSQREINTFIRFLPMEEVAILEFPSVPHTSDDMNHEDVVVLGSPGRQLTNDMSFEELLALEEQIGDVSMGLTEDAITECLNIRTYDSCASSSSVAQSPKSDDEEKPICVICQAEYEDHEKLGGLSCGHEYHTGCIKEWLLTKNSCPICKRPAISTEQ